MRSGARSELTFQVHQSQILLSGGASDTNSQQLWLPQKAVGQIFFVRFVVQKYKIPKINTTERHMMAEHELEKPTITPQESSHRLTVQMIPKT